jgi:hypothetical protein
MTTKNLANESKCFSLVNNTIKTSVLPTRLKEAQVVPLHKNNDPLDKNNYRPVSILPTISKVYEMVLDSLQRRMSCGRQSKAFERSIRIAATY